MKKRIIQLGLSLIAVGVQQTLAADYVVEQDTGLLWTAPRSDAPMILRTAQAISSRSVAQITPRVNLTVDPGPLACWGYNGYGQVSPLPVGYYVQVAVGYYHACAVKQDATVACWGYSGYIGTIPSGSFKQVTVGNIHTCGIKTDDTVACWGNSANIGTIPTGTFKQISANATNAAYTCGVKTTGALACWGATLPTGAIPSGTFLEVSAGDKHACGLKSDFTLACWGDNTTSQAAAPTGGYAQVAAGSTHTCAIKADNTVSCWRTPSTAYSTAPSGTFQQISAGYQHNCGVKPDKTLACWGDDASGSVSTVPTGQFQQVSAKYDFACAIKVGPPKLTVTKIGTGTGSVTSNPSGINCGNICSASFDAGSSVVLTATPTAPTTFTGWSGACSGTGTCTVTLNTEKAVTAAFALPNHILTVKKMGAGAGSISSNPVGINACTGTCTFSYVHGTNVALTASTGADSTFTGWSEGCTGSGACNVAMSGPKAVTGTFIASAANLGVTLTDGRTIVSTGESINYAAIVTNAGLGAGDGVMFKIPVVTNLTVNGITCTNAKGGAVCPSGMTVAALQGAGINIATLPKTGELTFMVNAKVGTTTASQLRLTATLVMPAGVADPVPANNSAIDSDRVVSRTDFKVTAIAVTPASPAANSNFNANVTVKNQGLVTASGGKLGLWYNQIPMTDVYCGTAPDMVVDVGSIAAGATKVLTFSNIPAGVTTGWKLLRAFVDQGCTVSETIETNNQLTYAYWVGGAADLIVTNIVLNPAAPTPNGTFSADITVKNQGTVAADGSFLDVWANSAATPACGTEGNGWTDVPNLAVGGTTTVTVTGLPAGVAGAKTLRAYVDSWCETVESVENNNQMTKTYTVQ